MRLQEFTRSNRTNEPYGSIGGTTADDDMARLVGGAEAGDRGGPIGVVKLLRGAGGMPRRHQDSGVEGCEMSGEAAQRASIPEYPRNPGN